MSISYNLSNLKTFTYSNLIKNGNFQGTTNWQVGKGSLSASANVLSVTGDGSGDTVFAYQVTDLQLTSGKKIFISALLRVTNSECNKLRLVCTGDAGTSIDVDSTTSPVSNTWRLFNGVFTQTNQTGAFTVYITSEYADLATANGKVTQAQEVIAVDLTAKYGAGREPSANDCLNIFRFVDGNKQPKFSKTLFN